MNSKKELYTFSWKQVYTEWEKQIDIIDALMDQIIADTEYKDAKEVINRIKGNLQ